MYGMLYRLRAKEGKERAALDHLFRWEREILPTAAGFIAGSLFQPAAAPTEVVAILVFASEADCGRVQNDPAHLAWYQCLLSLVEAEPECRDGEFTELLLNPPGL